jgi:hypothetical protein
MDTWIGSLDMQARRTHVLALLSDLHIEADDHDARSLDRDLRTAADVGARISINGDLTDLILPTDRKRYSRQHDQIETNAALNRITEIAYERLRPYADLIDVIGMGNHETAALKYHHYDIVLGVITLLNRDRSDSLPPIHHGGYKGLQRYRFHWKGHGKLLFDILRFHGSGGGAEVTKGMIDLNRLRSNYRADLYWVGHKHTSIIDNGMHEIYMGSKGKLLRREQRGAFTAGYKRPVVQEDSSRGYAGGYSDVHRTSQAQGCAWVTIRTYTNPVESPTGTGLEWTVSDRMLQVDTA